MKKVFLVFFNKKNKPPEIMLQNINIESPILFSPSLGYDLCDFLELSRNKNSVDFKYNGNYYVGKNNSEHELLDVNSYDVKMPLRILKPKLALHPYLKFLPLNDEKYINSNTIIYIDNKNTDSSEVANGAFAAHWELSQFFNVAETEGFTLSTLQKFMSNEIVLPKFTLGAIPEHNQDFKINIAKYKDYNRKLMLRKALMSYELVINGVSYNTDVTDTIFYICNNLLDLVFAYLYQIIYQGYNFKRCENCGKWFIPLYRSDTKYCDRFAPQNKSKTCKQYGRERNWTDTLKNNEAYGLYRKIYARLKMNATRNIDISEYQIKLKDFKRKSEQYKFDIKNGVKSDNDFLKWLHTID